MSDTYLMPNKQLAAAMLAPVRSVLTVVLGFSVLLLAFWGLCLFQYYGSWHQSMAPLGDMYQQAVAQVSPGQPLAHMAGWAERITRFTHEALFVSTGAESVRHVPAAGPSTIGSALGTVIDKLTPSLQVVILATQVFGVRMAILAGMLPLVLLGYVVALVDGLAERAVRRACAGRESAQLYHRAKYMLFASVGSALIVVLCLPMQAPPPMVMLLFATSVGLLARVQWTFYKKYA